MNSITNSVANKKIHAESTSSINERKTNNNS
jgi:hypothetical protein